jgi:hypothetical protein
MGKNPDSTKALVPMDQVLPMLESQGADLHIMFIDESGSMHGHGTTPQDSINEHIDGMQIPGDPREKFITVWAFGDKYRVLLPPTNVLDVEHLTGYCADGRSTLLYKSVYKVMRFFLEAIEAHGAKDNLNVYVGVFSDGGNNVAYEYQGKVQKAANMALKAGWELFSFGIGIDGQNLARLMGFPTDEFHAQTVEGTKAGVQRATQSFTASTQMGIRDPDFRPPTR